ncbi:MAG: TDT family transporter [Sutterella sp.]|nr:TDT family transporter [Sutterella sp.]
MIRRFHYKVRGLPTPLAGLALGIASLGWCMENALPLHGWGQTAGALLGGLLILVLCIRFAAHADTLWADLKHPVLGSIVPTFAMCLMVISRTAGRFSETAGIALWCAAVVLHLAALAVFVVWRLREPKLELMVPSWFVPPIGIVVADVTFPGTAALLPFAKAFFWMGLSAYAVLLPLMIYRLFFLPEVPNGAKPTFAILAAPASLLLAGYLSVESDPSLLLCALLFGIAVLMTCVIYFAFWRLLRLQFSPGYAAFTFPMAIGATALYKLSDLTAGFAGGEHYAEQIRWLAHAELGVAAAVIFYVSALYARHLPKMLPK